MTLNRRSFLQGSAAIVAMSLVPVRVGATAAVEGVASPTAPVLYDTVWVGFNEPTYVVNSFETLIEALDRVKPGGRVYVATRHAELAGEIIGGGVDTNGRTTSVELKFK